MPESPRNVQLDDQPWTLFRCWSGRVGLVHRADERWTPPAVVESHGLLLVADGATDPPEARPLSPLAGRDLVFRGSRPTLATGPSTLRWLTLPLGPLGEVVLLHAPGLRGHEVHWWSTRWSVPGPLACAVSQIPEDLRWSPQLLFRSPPVRG